MKPRDISQSQLWLEDFDDSLSSLESLGRSVDESSDTNEDTFRWIEPSNKGLPRRATFHNGCNNEAHETLACLNQMARKKYTRSSSRRSPPRNKCTNTQPVTRRPPQDADTNSAEEKSAGEELIYASPMRKFRCNTSDSALSHSRSCHTQRRRISQANAKWDTSVASSLKNSRRSCALRIGGSGNRFQQTINESIREANVTEAAANVTEEAVHHENDSAIGSRDTSTRWSASTQTRGDTTASQVTNVRCPRRQNSGKSTESALQQKNTDANSVCTPEAASAAAGEEDVEQASDKATMSLPNTTNGAGHATTQASTSSSSKPRMSRPQLPHRQKSFGKSSKTGYTTMEEAIQEAMAAQTTLEDLSEEDAAGWPHSLEFPQLEVQTNRSTTSAQDTSDSLVALMNPFGTRSRSRSPLRPPNTNDKTRSGINRTPTWNTVE